MTLIGAATTFTRRYGIPCIESQRARLRRERDEVVALAGKAAGKGLAQTHQMIVGASACHIEHGIVERGERIAVRGDADAAAAHGAALFRKGERVDHEASIGGQRSHRSRIGGAAHYHLSASGQNVLGPGNISQHIRCRRHRIEIMADTQTKALSFGHVESDETPGCAAGAQLHAAIAVGFDRIDQHRHEVDTAEECVLQRGHDSGGREAACQPGEQGRSSGSYRTHRIADRHAGDIDIHAGDEGVERGDLGHIEVGQLDAAACRSDDIIDDRAHHGFARRGDVHGRACNDGVQGIGIPDHPHRERARRQRRQVEQIGAVAVGHVAGDDLGDRP